MHKLARINNRKEEQNLTMESDITRTYHTCVPPWTTYEDNGRRRDGQKRYENGFLKGVVSERLAEKEVVKGKSDKGISKLCITFRMDVEKSVKNMGVTLDGLISVLMRETCNIFNISVRKYFQRNAL